MIEIDLLALAGELDPARLLALQEPALLGRDPVIRPEVGGAPRQLAAALVDRGEVKRPFPAEAEDRVAGAGVVEAAEGESGRGRRFLAARAGAQGFEEAGLVLLVDEPPRLVQIVLVHERMRTQKER
ncbi:MAG TPA: hypothetical protein VF574_11515 [Allosphingosinicella sp.]|jgi:hypothetical protein